MAGVVVAPAAWAIKRRYSGYRTRKMVAEGLCAELEDAMKALNGTTGHRQIKMTIIDPEATGLIKTCKRIRIVLGFLNHDSYDGFHYAGHLSVFDAGLVQDIQNVYQRIKHHNKWLEYMMPLRDKETETGKINLAVTSTYYNTLDKYESELLERIPDLKKRLERLAAFWPRFARSASRVRVSHTI